MFDSLGLSAATLHSLVQAGYTQPTPIQAQAIPLALTGRDVIGCAATGTGKTAAFVLPLVERLPKGGGTRALVLAPTRELALQIAEHVERFGRPKGLTHAVLIGGVGMDGQIKALKNNPDFLIATPGRLIDHLQQRTVSLSRIEALVLDEADRMLDMGFKPQLTRILGQVPVRRQTLLFSATMAGEVQQFAARCLRDPAKVEVSRSGTTAARAEQKVYMVPQQEKLPLLLALLAANDHTTLVFTRTKHRADKVARSLERAKHRVARIHANRSQAQRRQALDGFKSGQYRVLVATDIAARGIDVAEIGHVVNFDLPHVAEDYVHRVGRTARAAASGHASSFASPEELGLLKGIEKLTRTEVPRAQVPRESVAFQDELNRTHERERDPGPPQKNHRQSGRPAGKPPGRHARSHGKVAQASGGSGTASGLPSSTGRSLFSGGPKRRR